MSIGFSCSSADTSLFVFSRDAVIIYLLVYVDDIIITGNNDPAIAALTSRINKEFATKDLGRLDYFLGLKVSYTSSGLFLCQTKYAHDILCRAQLLDSKPVSTPLAPGVSFTKDGSPCADPTFY